MKALGTLLCMLILGSCASTPQSRQLLADGLGSLPTAVELTDTPFYPQVQYQCGPAALATVLQSRGINTTPDALSRQVYIPEREGSLQIEMAVAARRHNMLPYPLAHRLSDLFTEIAAGNPVLVLQNLGLEWFPQWHYAVVVGYNTGTQEVILRSGKTRRWVTSFEVFERTWQRADFWALAIVPAGEIPATAEPLSYLKSAYAFEETGNIISAQMAYRSATEHWPDRSVTWTALGNLALAGHDWHEAVSAFNTASNIDPESVIIWNNLAYALHFYGCRSQAMMSLQCGLKVSPADKNLQDSWHDLADSPTGIYRADCPAIKCY